MSLDHMQRIAVVYLFCTVGSIAATYFQKPRSNYPALQFIVNMVVSVSMVLITSAAITAVKILTY